MKFGVVFPTNTIGDDRFAIRDFAQAAEGLGLSRITIYDHVLGASAVGRQSLFAGRYTDASPFHEPLVLFGYLSGVTSTIEFATGVMVLPQRQTALVAKQVAELDLVSGGRFVLGVGIGWNPVEYEALGVPFRERGRRIEEQVHVLRALWQQPVVNIAGRCHRIDRASILPRPRSLVPIWFGGRSDRMLARAAKLGDGFISASPRDLRLEQAARLHHLLRAVGRPPSDFGLEAFVDYSLGAEAWLEQSREWEAAGGSLLSIRRRNVAGGREARLDAHIAVMDTFATALLG